MPAPEVLATGKSAYARNVVDESPTPADREKNKQRYKANNTRCSIHVCRPAGKTNELACIRHRAPHPPASDALHCPRSLGALAEKLTPEQHCRLIIAPCWSAVWRRSSRRGCVWTRTRRSHRGHALGGSRAVASRRERIDLSAHGNEWTCELAPRRTGARHPLHCRLAASPWIGSSS